MNGVVRDLAAPLSGDDIAAASAGSGVVTIEPITASSADGKMVRRCVAAVSRRRDCIFDVAVPRDVI